MGPLIVYDACPELTNAEQYASAYATAMGLFKSEAEARRSPFKGKDDKIFKITITIEEVKE